MAWTKERRERQAATMKALWGNPKAAARMRKNLAKARKSRTKGRLAKAMVRRWKANPVKADAIAGFVLRGYTVVVPKADIPTLIRQLAAFIE